VFISLWVVNCIFKIQCWNKRAVFPPQIPPYVRFRNPTIHVLASMPLDLPVRVKQNGTEMGQNLCAWIRARDHERGALDARTWLLSLYKKGKRGGRYKIEIVWVYDSKRVATIQVAQTASTLFQIIGHLTSWSQVWPLVLFKNLYKISLLLLWLALSI